MVKFKYYRDLLKMGAKMKQNKAEFDAIKDLPTKITYQEPVVHSWVVDMQNVRHKIIPLNADVWNHEIRKDIVMRTVNYYRALTRNPANPAKTRGTRNGSGIKMRPQKVLHLVIIISLPLYPVNNECTP